MEKNIDLEKRSGWIDILRGIAISCVVFGHICRNDDAHAFVYSFHLALFFFAGGLCLKKRTIIAGIKREAYKLLVPYFIWGVISIVYYESMYHAMGKGSSLCEILGMFGDLLYGDYFHLHYNRVLWFLPCYFCLVIFNNIIVNIFGGDDFKTVEKGMTYRTTIALIVISIIGMIMTCFEVLPVLPWGLDRVVKFELYYAMGIILRSRIKEYEENLIKKKCLYFVSIIIVLCGLFFLMFSVFSINNLLKSAYATGIVGVIVFVIMSKMIEESRVLEKIGRCSIGILCFHAVLYESFLSVLLRYLPAYEDEFISAFPCLISTIVIFISIVIYEFIVAKLPIVFGKI